MGTQNSNDFSYSFESSQSPEEIYGLLLHVEKWWNGLHAEQITGISRQVGDEFSFSAGNGVHFSKHKLIELIPSSKITWLVTESNLSFLTNTAEWTGTSFGFHIEQNGQNTKVTFTHTGLVPQIECYGRCTNAWSKYLDNLAQKLS